MPRHNIKAHGPDPVDLHVGGRIKQRRLLLGWAQTRLARALGITFQQVQKYEQGLNRVSASRLWRIAEALDVPVSFFFDGCEATARSAEATARSGSAPAAPPAKDGQLRALGTAFAAIEHPRLRRMTVDYAAGLASVDDWLRRQPPPAQAAE